jgi:hypothetical protein
MAVVWVAGSSFFWAPARFRNIKRPLKPTKTKAQKINIPRDDFLGRSGNAIMLEKYAIYFAATAEFAGLNHEWTRIKGSRDHRSAITGQKEIRF